MEHKVANSSGTFIASHHDHDHVLTSVSSTPSSPVMNSSSTSDTIEAECLQKTDDNIESGLEQKAAGPEIPSEEGFKGWLCAVGSFIAVFCTFGFLNAIGVFQTFYQATTLSAYSPSEISWIFAIQLALMWVPGPLFGRLIDTYGPAPVLYPASFLCVFSLCMTSLSTKYYQIFLAQGIGFGIGAGGAFTASVVCCGQWFVKRRGLGVGVACAGSGLVMDQVGFYGALRYTALFVGILLASSCFLVTARLPRRKWNRNAKWIDFRLFKQKQIALYAFGSFLAMWGVWAPFDYLPSMAVNIGFSETMALYLISILNASSVFGRVYPPYLGDRVGHFNVLTVSAFLAGASILCLWLPFSYHHSHAGIIVFALIYGFVSGSYVSLLMPCIAKAGDIETIGQRFGTFQTIVGLSCLTGLPILGAILNRQHDVDFSGLQIFAAVSILLGTAMSGGARFFVARLNKTWRV
ncbi:MAG: hypothetical protein M1834_005622 [Cirrosporium novae-zelandiae]|nr:MAG: hypothetical protein M1834_005622 [Cirrosporium novae-zelandiae]